MLLRYLLILSITAISGVGGGVLADEGLEMDVAVPDPKKTPTRIMGQHIQWLTDQNKLVIKEDVRIEYLFEQEQQGEDGAVAKVDKEMVITTDGSGTLNRDQGVAVFKKNVFVVEPDTSLKAHTVKIHLDQKTKKLDRVEAYGSVAIEQKQHTAYSRKAIFYVKQDEIILLGNPKIVKGLDSYKADVIKLYEQGKRVVFEPQAELIVYEEATEAETAAKEEGEGEVIAMEATMIETPLREESEAGEISKLVSTETRGR